MATFLGCLLILSIARTCIAGGLASTPPRGWNSYDSFSWIISEKEFLENAQVVADTLLPFGYEYVVVDFLWFRKLDKGASVQSPGHDLIDKWGRPVPDPDRWPSTAGGKGFAPIAEKIHGMGLKFGIHVMRGISTAAVANNTPIFGTKGWKAQDIALTKQPCPWMQECFLSVNTSSVGGKAFIKSLYDQYASWGVDFVKHDCVFGADNINLEEIQAVSKAILDTGRPIVYSLSPGVQATPELASKVSDIVHMYRVTGDDWDRWGDVAAHFDVASKFAAAHLIGAPGLGGGRSWPDLDMLPLGWLTDAGAPYGPYRDTKLTLDEQRSQLTLWAMAKSPLMFGGDLRHIDQTTYSMITNPTLLDINAHSFGNLEYFAGTVPGAEALPLLTLINCDADTSHWTLQDGKLCWNISVVCFNWTSSENILRREATEEVEGIVQMWTPQMGDLCLDSKNIVTSIGMFATKRFSMCSLHNSQTWRLLPSGKLKNAHTNLCAVVKVEASMRIWVAQGSRGQYYVAFFNLGQNSTDMSYSLEYQTGAKTRSKTIKTKTLCSGEEIWSRKELEEVESLSMQVPPHGCRLFSLVCVSNSSGIAAYAL